MKKLFILFIVFMLGCSTAFAAPLTETKYDPTFEKYMGLYLPQYDWQWLKAQCYAESRFNENAVSPVGAMGLCQFMRGTWNEMQNTTGIKASPYNYKVNIQFSAIYMSRLVKMWNDTRRDSIQRLKFAQASYNAGAGNILKAQKRSEDKIHIDPVLEQLLYVTGAANRKETTTYVARIQQFYDKLMKNLTVISEDK